MSSTIQWCYPKYWKLLCHFDSCFSMSIIIKIINFIESKIKFSKFCSYGATIFNILDNTTELYMTKYIIGEIFSSGSVTLYKKPSELCNAWLLQNAIFFKILEHCAFLNLGSCPDGHGTIFCIPVRIWTAWMVKSGKCQAKSTITIQPISIGICEIITQNGHNKFSLNIGIFTWISIS